MGEKINLKRDQNGRFAKGNTGFWLGKARSKATVDKIINSNKINGKHKIPNSGQFKKDSQINLGRILSLPEKMFISEQTKKGMTPEIRKIISNGAQIRVKNGTHQIFKACCKKGECRNPQNCFKKGSIPWNTGIPMREESKKKLSASLIKYYQKHPEAIVKWVNEVRRNIIVPFNDTKIEIKVQNYLKQLGIEFYTHQYMQEIEHGYHCDIFIPVQKGISKKTIIECDGIYWHGYPAKYPNPTKEQKEQIKTDKIRTRELEDNGFRVIRLWENEINRMKIDKFKEQIYNLEVK